MKQDVTFNVRKADDRGQVDHGWLNSYHTFSFGDYHDPEHMGFRSLRVINEDTVAPARGFGEHPHRDMEIISVVIDGALEHKDSMGNGSVIRQGQVQKITAGRGITHSEFNHSSHDAVHFLQIWIQPQTRGLEPSYSELDLSAITPVNGFKLIGSPTGEGKSMTIHQDARIYYAQLPANETVIHNTDPQRGLWIQVIRGHIKVLDQSLHDGDGISLEQLAALKIQTDTAAEFLLFDLG